ncbi:N-acetyltransferase [Aneurinibacillus aneurinilyticus]|jgi:hypothetical protein|uniref:N-acetyltransferase n=2 Tax=Aneurinibacillus aneurinilyticus TaxID=1391 RepID=A0A848CRW3_ANEAE|nr:N-acetyltransferase [Aneurinibacillus aneurinilyticus]ERI05894.1 hypothetical protein HMPREF0083_05456 [Aneurinibacillus aneurinilyticus ATCC 12856]MCI1692651.1 N-acetyltransferase [Aneurinibacillus aneurinilyticus]MED0672760.1 N-acetyltransferase [Aneurinibacillus aneurinilyticus]MED0708587.1 N-acetyltransferase [Aneurinibacillus aneurinilyticus]MED0721747.1 N-acetyltransferase [Aneurinibacillus aneurinilyticus]
MKILREFERVFETHRIPYHLEQKEEHHYLYRTEEEMRDAGMTPNNVMLDLFFDHKNEAMFLGMIRVPHKLRGKNIGADIVTIMKEFAKEHHWVIILESAPENLLFWQKMHFSSFMYETYGFWMMGYGAKSKLIFKVKWTQMKKNLYAEAF